MRPSAPPTETRPSEPRPSTSAPPLVDVLVQVVDHQAQDAPWQMAADEQLVRSAQRPTLRFYHWRRPQVTFGYFLRCGEVAERCPGRAATRRWTGGGIVHHGEDVTFSLVFPSSCPLCHEPGRVLYEKIHHCVARGLEQDSTEPQVQLVGASPLAASPHGGPSECFRAPVAADVLRRGRKIAGGALRRTRSGILYQGSIYEPGLTDCPKLAEGLREQIARALTQELHEATWTTEQQEEIEKLTVEKYATPEWNHRF